MTKEELKKLLGKYYNAEISKQEEIILREYFRNEEAPELFRNEKEIFGFYSDERQIPEPSAGFNERLISSIDMGSGGEDYHFYRKLILSVAGIAAGLLILIGSWLFFTRSTGPRDTFSDPELAYAEAMKILHDVSYRLNQGTAALEPVGRMQAAAGRSLSTINRSTLKIDESLDAFDNYTKGLENIDLRNN